MPEHFGQQYQKEVDRLHAPADALTAIREKSAARQGHVRWVRYAAVAAAAVVVVGGGLGFLLGRSAKTASSAVANDAYLMATSAAMDTAEAATDTASLEASSLQDSGTVDGISLSTDGILSPAGSYEALFAVVEDRNGNGYARDEANAGDAVAVAEDAAVLSEEATASTTASAGTDYSTTNVQVEGIDEADILKTDGSYLYYLTGNTVRILSAQGADTKLLSSTEITLSNGNAYFTSPVGLFLDGDRMTVLLSASAMVFDAATGSDSVTFAAVYDISDRTAPKQVALLGQSGYYTDARLQDGTIYLVTTEYLWGTAVADTPATYCPSVYDASGYSVLPADSIYVSSHSGSAVYTIVSTVTPQAPETPRSTLAVLGANATVYQSEEHLLLAMTEYHSDRTDIAPDEQGRNVCTDSYYSDTTLVLVDTADGALSLAASTVVDGYLNSQYALDEHNGCIRAVTTTDVSICRIYTDGIDTYEWEDSSSNCLFILDGTLTPLSSLTGLAEGEYVQSVRFDGDMLYITTFRSVDPLFTVDVSDPTAPQVLGALEIAGFSDYMHVYTSGRLLGIGYQADQETGWTSHVKLTMFDTTDPADVKELTTVTLTADWTLVGSCPQAVLVDAEKNLIAFPTEEGYEVYGYSDADGFVQRAFIPVEQALNGYQLRGAYVDGSFYVCASTGVSVMDLQDFALIRTVAF